MTEKGTSASPSLDMGGRPPSSARLHTRHGDSQLRRWARDLRSSAGSRPASATTTQPFDASIGGVLSRDPFLGQLRSEKLRADRSKAPLSLMICRLANPEARGDASRMRDLLARSKRETDTLGHLGSGVFAVICPDTGESGVCRFVERINAGGAHLSYSVESATYPDDLFETFAAPAARAHGPSPLMIGGHRASMVDSYWLKRPMDVLGSALALLIFSPLMLLTALAVKLTSPGPIVFRQTRLGKGGVPFVFYKFRSMIVNGDDHIHREFVAKLIKGEHEKLNQQDAAQPMYKIKADPRVTPVGRFIRKTSIDELPQLFNVLKGEMSLIGPRPPLPYEAQSYQTWHLRRVLDIRPGITGLWQVEGRSKVSFDEMVRMDLRYVRGCSLLMDLKILAKTVLAVLNCKGAA
jgi:lipopolysaccharide/colanic/teichoic acid biosynthesis glycosyltransferase/transposase-like protein